MNDSKDQVWQAFSQRLFDQNRFAIKLGLDNMRRAFALCGHPEKSAPAIVVGGTNGKGTVASMTAAILQAHGLRVGLYTSPHLIEVRERFRVDGVPLPREMVLEEGRAVLEQFGDPETSDPCLTFFELTTLIAARLFAKNDVDVVLWEVGLGGRLDAVNAIEPALTLITTIGFDHQQYLGDTMEEIAGEKAALLRSDVPALIGAQEYQAAEELFRQVAGPRHRFVEDEENGLHKHREQAKRAARIYLDKDYDASLAEVGFGHWVWPGRFDTRRIERDGNVLHVIFDAAHNADGLRHLQAGLDQPADGMIVAAMNDKITDDFIGTLRRIGAGHIWCASLQTKRAADANALASKLDGAAVPAADAIDLAFATLDRDATLIVCGSVYLLGEVFSALGYEAEEMRTWRQD